MTFKYTNVYINETSMITGPYEKSGPMQAYFDKSYDDLYFGTKTWESAESKLIEESVEFLLKKINKNKKEIDVHISGDLLNQIIASNFAANRIKIPFLGIFSACAASCESLIIGANMIESGQIRNCICTTSSHNNAAEKQFRYPIEYGGPKPKTSAFTTTAGVGAYLSYNKKGVKIESSTIGSVFELGITDPFNMGSSMVPAAGQTIYRHLQDTKREVGYYDLILTGDLGIYGKEILKDYMKKEYNLDLNNYNDAGTMIYYDDQPVLAGGSGPACLPLVVYGDIFQQMQEKKLNKVLIVATGALLSQVSANQKKVIPCIAHAVSLEAI